jgi:hypothetical protein
MAGIFGLLLSGAVRVVDQFYEYVTLLLPGNGTNGAQNNTFLDGSTNNFTITRNGNTTQGTFSPFSQTGWGNYFNGSNAYLSLTATSAVQLTNSTAFAIEFWVYPASIPSTGGSAFVLRAYNISSPYQGYGIAFGGNGQNTNLQIWNGTVWADIGAVSANTWTHIAVTYEGSGSTLRYFINGQQQGSATTVPSSINYTGTPFIIGARNSDFYLNSYISNLRIVKGSAVYTSNFTPSTTPLTAITNTSLLTCQSNRFLDNSGSPYTITPNGSPTVVAFSPFNPTASWSAATYGGSGYFDGSGDYLTAPNNAAFAALPGDFTLELWVYLTAQTTGNALFGPWAGSAGSAANSSWLFTQGTTSASNLRFVYSNGSSVVIYEGSGGLGTNQWFHLVAVRSGTNFALFSNGNRVYSNASVSASIPQNTSNLGVMAGADGAFASTGYVSSARVVKGTAVYDPTLTTLTVPTAPLTAITNTSLLLNFTNAGIYDATSKNDLETVGNAQISTAQSKWGGSSMAFDGTGDWLLIPDQPIQRIGTGNFTVEGWVYRNSSGTYGLVGKGTGTTGWLLSLNSSNQVVFTYGSSTITSTGTVSATTWTHIAVVREGTSTNQTKIYINGTNDGTGTVSTDFNQTNSMYVGADRTGGSAANVYMQDVRVTNYARYVTGTGANAGKMVFNGTNDLALPTAAFPTL